MEVENQTHFSTGETQIGKQLRFMDPLNSFSAFEFDYNSICYEDIDAVTAVEFRSFVKDRQSEFPFESETSKI